MAFYFFQFVRGLHCLLELLLEKSRYDNRKIFRSNRGECKREGRNYRHSSFCIACLAAPGREAEQHIGRQYYFQVPHAV